MARVFQPTPDGHSRRFPTVVNRDFVFVPVTQQGGMTIRNSQFPRHGGDGEQRRQAFYPLPPMEMSRGGHADELITRQLRIFCHHWQRYPQLQGRGFDRKPRFQPPHLFGPALRALDGAVDLGDFIPLPQRMHSRPADSQHPPNLGVGFVQVPADDFEPRNCRGPLPLESRVGLHRPADIYRIFCREFKHYFIARFAVSVAKLRQTPEAGAGPSSVAALRRVDVPQYPACRAEIRWRRTSRHPMSFSGGIRPADRRQGISPESSQALRRR